MDVYKDFIEKNDYRVFLDKICKSYNCGSQRCDGSEEWLDGCKMFQDFKRSYNSNMTDIEIDDISRDILNKYSS